MAKIFEPALSLHMPNGDKLLRTIEDAQLALSSIDWPNRGPAHRDALETCLKVEDGHRSMSDARTALQAAAEEAGGSLK